MSNLAEAFESRTKSLSVIFESYSLLHDIYSSVLKSANVPDDKQKLFDNTKTSAREKQNEISDQLHTQAFILMSGRVEALLKDILDSLILENFTKMNNVSNIQFTIGDLKRALDLGEQQPDFVINQLAEMTIGKLSNVKNRNEVVNFQNVQSMKDSFSRMFGLKLENIEEDLLNKIRVYWAKRHLLVHSDGIIDERYKTNTRLAGYDVGSIGDRVTITKTDYDKAKNDYKQMLKCLEEEILSKGLKIEGVG